MTPCYGVIYTDAFEDNMRFRGAEIASISSDDVISHVEQIEKDLKQGSTK